MSPEMLRLIASATGETLMMVAIAAAIGTLFGLPLGVFLATSGKGIVRRPLGQSGTGRHRECDPFDAIHYSRRRHHPVHPPHRRNVDRHERGDRAPDCCGNALHRALDRRSIREVDQGLIEAARAFGASPLQIVLKVLIPEALPTIVLGLTLALVSLIGLLFSTFPAPGS